MPQTLENNNMTHRALGTLAPAVPRILVVEDDTIVLGMLEQVLERSNYHVVAGLANGEDAVERIRELRPDLILMDVSLDGAMDGIETARQINARYDVPIIYLTARTDDETVARAVSTGPYGYLIKPINLRELRRSIEVALAKHAMQEELALSEARYRRMFEAAAVSLWEEDISLLLAHLNDLQAQGVSDLRTYMIEHPEFVKQATAWIRVVDVNDAALHLFGADRKEQLLGPLTPLILPDALYGFRDRILAIFERRVLVEYETVAQTLQGLTKHILIRVTLPQDIEHNTTMLTSITDITQRVEAEEVMRKLHAQVRSHAVELEERVADRTRELSTLYAISEVASEALDLETMLSRSLRRTLGAVRSDIGFVHLLADSPAPGKAPTLEMTVAQGEPPEGMAWIDALPPDGSILHWIIVNDAPLVLNDTASAPEYGAALEYGGAPKYGDSPGYKEPPVHGAGLRLPPHRYIGMPMRAGGRIVGVLSVLRDTGQPVFSAEEVALLTSVADQVGAGVESARLRRQAEQAAITEERHRLARDLHDSVTQSLYSLTLLTEGARRMALAGKLEDTPARFAELREISLQCLKEMRLLIYQLRASGLEGQGTLLSLQRRIEAVERRSGIDARLVVEKGVNLSRTVEEAVAGVAHEALNNTLKHAHATSIQVLIKPTTEGVELRIVDDGRGFEPMEHLGTGGLGLTTMRERAERLGGTLTITSTPPAGTTVIATFPSR